jgi:hypothetical protein
LPSGSSMAVWRPPRRSSCESSSSRRFRRDVERIR